MITADDLADFTDTALLQLRQDWRDWDGSLDPDNELDDDSRAQIFANIEAEIKQRGL